MPWLGFFFPARCERNLTLQSCAHTRKHSHMRVHTYVRANSRCFTQIPESSTSWVIQLLFLIDWSLHGDSHWTSHLYRWPPHHSTCNTNHTLLCSTTYHMLMLIQWSLSRTCSLSIMKITHLEAGLTGWSPQASELDQSVLLFSSQPSEDRKGWKWWLCCIV